MLHGTMTAMSRGAHGTAAAAGLLTWWCHLQRVCCVADGLTSGHGLMGMPCRWACGHQQRALAFPATHVLAWLARAVLAAAAAAAWCPALGVLSPSAIHMHGCRGACTAAESSSVHRVTGPGPRGLDKMIMGRCLFQLDIHCDGIAHLCRLVSISAGTQASDDDARFAPPSVLNSA